jgi:hypothetical protein
MATAKKNIEVKEAPEAERIPSHSELLLEQLMNAGFVLVQWIGSKTITKLAPSPSGIIRQFGVENYGLVGPKEWLMIHKSDIKPGKRYYRRPTAKEKPAQDKVNLIPVGNKGVQVRVTWEGMPVDTLDHVNRRPL